MKNLFKFGFLALALSLTFAACSNENTAEGTDTTSTDTLMTTDSSMVVDSAATVDSTVTDSAATN